MSQVPPSAVQAALCDTFRCWGQPSCIRVDNGLPFNDPGSDLPPLLSLWVIGNGIKVIWNRPRRPTDNAKVERMQGVTADWAEPHGCVDAVQLHERLEAATEMQRTHYPVRRLGGRTREETFPGLGRGGTPFREDGFDYGRVLEFLSQGWWMRRVGKQGQVEFFKQRWSIGRRHARQDVSVVLDAETRQWIVKDEQGHELKRFGCEFLSQENICSLTLGDRRGKRARKQQNSTS